MLAAQRTTAKLTIGSDVQAYDVSVDLGGTDATPAFDLSDATESLPTARTSWNDNECTAC